MSRKLYVGNLPYDTEEAQLQDLFAQFGQVDSVRVIARHGHGPGPRLRVR